MSDHNGNGHDPREPDGHNIIRLPSLAERQRMQRAEAANLNHNKAQPFLNIPPMTKAMLAVLVAVQFLCSVVLDPAAREDVYEHLGFVPGAFTGHAPFTMLDLLTPFTYMLLHGGWIHLAMNGLMLMAFGSGVERWMGPRRLLIFCLLSGIIAAAAQLALDPASTDPVIGASGALSGLFAAVMVMMNRMRANAGLPTTRMMPFIILWIVLTAGSGMIGMPNGNDVAWAAHIGGFLGGFVILRLMRIA